MYVYVVRKKMLAFYVYTSESVLKIVLPKFILDIYLHIKIRIYIYLLGAYQMSFAIIHKA